MKRVGVIGGGTMGAGIAEVVARAGDSVPIMERDTTSANAATDRIQSSLARAVKSGRLDTNASADISARINVTLGIEDFADHNLVIEAAPEIEAVKLELFRTLDDIVGPSAILATNTSAIPVIRLANATRNPGWVIGIHFFNSVPVLPLVEIVVSLTTAEHVVVDQVTTYVQERLGKGPSARGTGQVSWSMPADSVPGQFDQNARNRIRQPGGYRRRHDQWLCLSSWTSDTVRQNRPRRRTRDHGIAARRVPGATTQSAAVVTAHGRCRSSR